MCVFGEFGALVKLFIGRAVAESGLFNPFERCGWLLWLINRKKQIIQWVSFQSWD